MIIHSLSRKFSHLLAFTTTREDFGVPAPGFTGGDNGMNREKLARLLNIPVSGLVFPRQCHTGNIAVIGSPPKGDIPDTDALITCLPGICLCIQTADCVPVLLFDPEKKVTGAVHAGWKGTLAYLSGLTVARMQTEYGCDPGNIHAVIGPSIGPAVYETGHEVARLFAEKYPDCADFLIMGKNGKYHLDLWKANTLQLLAAGLKPAHIDITKQCTYESAALFFSARREGFGTGRMVSGVVMSS